MDYGIINVMWYLNCPQESGGSWASFSNTYQIDSAQAPGPDLVAELTTFAAGFMTTVANVMGGRNIYALVKTRKRTGGAFPDIDDEVWLDDGGFASPGPYWASVMIRKYSGDPERYRRGRVYIPFIGAPIAQSAFLGDFATEFQYVADAFATVQTSGTMTLTPMVENRVAGTWEQVTRCDVSPFLAFQRRRNASTRYYSFP